MAATARVFSEMEPRKTFVPRFMSIAAPMVNRNRKGSIHDGLMMISMIVSSDTAKMATGSGSPGVLSPSFIYFMSLKAKSFASVFSMECSWGLL